MKKSFCISAIVVLTTIFAGSARAALLGVNVIPPIISYSNAGSLSLNYNSGTQIFTVTTTPSTIKFSPTDPTLSVIAPHSMTIKIQVDNTGALVGSVGPGPDLVISGKVTRVVGTVTNVYSGLLLTGQITAFGYQYTGTGIDDYDFRFTPTGGQLESFYLCDHIGVELTSEGSTFTGFFITNFNGQSKGNVGLEDTTPPSITCPFDSTATNVECSVAGGQTGAYVTFPNPIVSDNCTTNPLVTCSPTNGSFFALAPGTNMTSYTVSCTAQDASGNTNSCSFTITVVDDLPPDFNDNPFIDACDSGPITLPTDPGSCSAMYTFQEPTASSSCCTASVPVSVSAIDDNGFIIPLTVFTSNGIAYVTGSFPQSCTGSNVITSTANDGRGNTAQAQCALFVFDNQPPTIVCSNNQTVACTNGPVIYVDPMTSDNCPNFTVSCTPTNGSFLGVGVYNVTCTAIDGCGQNTNSCTFTLNVVDTTPPAITCPSNTTVQCGQPTDPSNTGSATAIDDCDPNPSVTSTDTVTGTCPTYIYRTWIAVDFSGNTNQCTQVITIVDTTPPSILCPADVQLQCGASTDPSNTGSATATDTCSTATITFADTLGATNCTGKAAIARVWTATDACGNSASCTQNITFVDTTAPVITCPADQQLQCGASTNPSNTGSATATDNCGGSVAIKYSDTPTAANCTGMQGISRVWTATDGCGNSASCTQSITFVDTTPPVITCPANVQLQCGASTAPANTGSATASDNCTAQVQVGSVGVTVTYSDTPTPANCTGNPGIARIWTAVDGCGNSASCTQLITFVDTTPPVITCPANVQLQCGASTAPANTGSATATDNCGGTVTITHTDSPTPANCTGNPGIARIWTATDACGNSASCTQSITFVDTTAPVITCPANVQLQCGASTAPANTGSATATDNCGGTVTITHTDVATPANCTGNAGISRIWTATDACGNSASCTQSITFVNTTAPAITCPANAQLQCGASTAPANTGSATATSNCGGAVTITYSDTPTAANCTGNAGISRTWKATDACGNSSTCVQTITFVDTTPPVITCPASVQLQCGASTNTSSTGSATATDNCGGAVTITYSDSPTAADCTGKAGIARIWKATDACGNSATCTQSITFVDTTAPILTSVPTGASLGCNPTNLPTNASITALVTATDNCSTPTISVTHVDGSAACMSNRTFAIVAVDGCGNTSATQTVVYTWTADNTAPTLSGCTNQVVYQQVTVTNGQCCIKDVFNCKPISAGNWIWFNSTLNPCSGITNKTYTVNITGQTITGTIGGSNVSLTVPNAQITYSSTCTNATTTFTNGIWVTTCPLASTLSGGQCGAALAYQLPFSSSGLGNLSWCASFSVPPGVPVNWQWAASVYTNFSANYTALGCKPVDDAKACGYKNTDAACTPENFKQYCVYGARCGTFGNYCGNRTCPSVCNRGTTTVCSGGVVQYTAPTAADNCGGVPKVTCVPLPGVGFVTGSTNVICTAVDDCGNTNTCSFSVILEAPLPTINCPGNITTNTTSTSCSQVVKWTATGTNACGGSVTVTCSPTNGSTFAKGTTPVTCTAIQTGGGTNSCSFTVTVNDTTPPTIACPGTITTNTCNSTAVVKFTPTVGDNCSGVAYSCTPTSGYAFAQGTTTVTCKATDGSGNTASCSFSVVVTGVAPCMLNCPTATAGTGKCILTWATESMGTAPFTYNVLRSTSSSGPFTTICSGITSLCYTNTGTTKGTKYYFCVTATNCKGTGANSPTASCTSN